jgi:hypothetical protein
MGETAKDFSSLSWDGKNADNPKPFGKVTAGNEPLTAENLAEFEQKMLRLMHEMAEKVPREQADRE